MGQMVCCLSNSGLKAASLPLYRAHYYKFVAMLPLQPSYFHKITHLGVHQRSDGTTLYEQRQMFPGSLPVTMGRRDKEAGKHGGRQREAEIEGEQGLNTLREGTSWNTPTRTGKRKGRGDCIVLTEMKRTRAERATHPQRGDDNRVSESGRGKTRKTKNTQDDSIFIHASNTPSEGYRKSKMIMLRRIFSPKARTPSDANPTRALLSRKVCRVVPKTHPPPARRQPTMLPGPRLAPLKLPSYLIKGVVSTAVGLEKRWELKDLSETRKLVLVEGTV